MSQIERIMAPVFVWIGKGAHSDTCGNNEHEERCPFLREGIRVLYKKIVQDDARATHTCTLFLEPLFPKYPSDETLARKVLRCEQCTRAPTAEIG